MHSQPIGVHILVLHIVIYNNGVPIKIKTPKNKQESYTQNCQEP